MLRKPVMTVTTVSATPLKTMMTMDFILYEADAL
jgi:hypothetical protein